MYPLQGTAGGQDVRRQSALKYLSELRNGAPQTPTNAPADVPETDVASHLQKALQLTLAQPDQIAQNQASWRGALAMLAQQMPEIGQPQGGPQPPSVMAMGAQGAPMQGRPPR